MEEEEGAPERLQGEEIPPEVPEDWDYSAARARSQVPFHGRSKAKATAASTTTGTQLGKAKNKDEEGERERGGGREVASAYPKLSVVMAKTFGKHRTEMKKIKK